MTSNVRLALAVLAATFLALPGRAQDAQEPPRETAQDPAGESAPEAAEPAEGEQPEDGGPEAGGAGAEGEQPASAGEAAAEEAGAGGPVVVDEEEGSVLDDQTFEGEDDDFIPTEQIPVDEPIPFPSDI